MKRNKYSPGMQKSSSRVISSVRKGESPSKQDDGEMENFDPSSLIQPSSNAHISRGRSGLGKDKAKNSRANNSPHNYQRDRDSSGRGQKEQMSKVSRVREQSISLKESKVRKVNGQPSYKDESTPIQRYERQKNERYAEQMRRGEVAGQGQEEPQTPQKYKIKELNANMSKLSDSLLDLRENYNRLEEDGELITNIKDRSRLKQQHSQHLPHQSRVSMNEQPQLLASSRSVAMQGSQLRKSQAVEPKNSEEVLRFLQQKQRQKQERHKKLQKEAERGKSKIQEAAKQRQREEEEFLSWRRSQIRETGKYQQKRTKEKQKGQHGKKVLEEFIKKWDGKTYLHQVKENDFQKKEQEQFKLKREAVVSERKEVYRPMNREEIDEHQKNFYAKRVELDQVKQTEADQRLQKITEENSGLQYWKGNSHEIIAEERKRLRDRKKEPLQKFKKVRDYKQYIHENFSPKAPKSSSAQPHHETPYDPAKYTKVKRYRYYKGHSYGQVAQTQPVSRNAQQIKRIGNSNMQVGKKLIKKEQQGRLVINAYTPQPQRKFQLDYVHNIFSEDLQFHKQKQTKVAVPDKVSRQDLKAMINKLKSFDDRLGEKQKALSAQRKDEQHSKDQKLLNQRLVDNIERKLSMLSQL